MDSTVSNKSVDTLVEECPQVPDDTVHEPEAPKPVLENSIYISDKAKTKVISLMNDAGLLNDPAYFLRVG